MKGPKRRIVGIVSFKKRAGAQEAMLRLMRQLRERGHETEVWFLYEQASCYQDEERVRVLMAKPSLTLFEYLTLFARLVHLLRKERPDAVVAFLPLSNVIGLTAAALAGVPRRVVSQRTPSFAFGRVMRVLDRLVGSTPICHAIVCVADGVKESFSTYPRVYQQKLSVVHNALEWEGSTLSKAQARHAFGLPPDDCLFVATGRLDPVKNYAFLIRVTASLTGVHLAIGGEGTEDRTLRALTRELGVETRVHFLGQLTREGVRNLLRAADAFVHGAHYEGHSNSILEAMHEGLLVIANDVDTIRGSMTNVQGEVMAMLCRPGDLDQWGEALRRVRDDRASAEALGERGRTFATQRYRLSRMLDGFEAALLLRTADVERVQERVA